jgi:hypothetical protein
MRKGMKARLRTLIVVVMSAVTAQLAFTSTAEAAKKTAIHKKHHKHTFRDLPSNDPVGSLHTR